MLNASLDRLTAYASVRSVGGTSVFDGKAVITRETVNGFTSSASDIDAAVRDLEAKGFSVERVGVLYVRLSAPATVFRNRLGLVFEKVQLEARPGEYAIPDMWSPTPQSEANLMATGISAAEGVVFPQPVILHQTVTPTSPPLIYHHLRVPDDVVRLLNAGPVHAAGFRGQGIRAAMIDSGFYWSHPYFRGRNYRLRVALQPDDVLQDKNGHGTGESSNLLAIAPEVELFGVAMDDLIEAFEVARVDVGAQIISNSWGTSWPTDGPNGMWHPYWSLVQAQIALCAQQGIIVLFSGGNGGMSFTASMPETISVGGVYIDAPGNMQASNYASSFDSTRFPGQHVPEICGLVGLQPKAIYTALPIPPGSEIDVGRSGPSFPNNDETGADDGWGVFSGTSAACPQAAGVVALILSRHPGEDLAAIRQRLYNATDVTQGQSFHGDQAGPGYDNATGHGLINADLACQ